MPPNVAEIVAAAAVVTVFVLISKVAVVCPSLIVTLEGTEVTFVLVVEVETEMPPAGAAPLKVIVPVALSGPATAEGVTESEDKRAAAG
jgi:hypothetical protein